MVHKVRVGDLVKFRDCAPGEICHCVFCLNESNRVGVITEAWTDECDDTSVIATFDFGDNTFWSMIDEKSTHSKRSLTLISEIGD